MKNWRLGTKLAIWSSFVVAVALLICGLAAVLFIQKEQIESLDDQLRNEAHTFFGEIERKSENPDWYQHPHIKSVLPVTRTERFVRIVRNDAEVLYQAKHSKLENVRTLPVGMHTLRVRRGSVRLGVFSQGDLTLYLGAALNEINADGTDMLVGLLVVVPLLVALVAGGGWWLAQKALAPVRTLTTTTREITATQLDRRLPIPPSRDEIGELTDVLNSMLDRLESSFEQAMRFSADASHELKTPLTVLRSSIEYLLDSPTLAPADQGAVAELLEQIRRLSSITEGLLLLARADGGRLKIDAAPNDIGDLILTCVEDAGIMAEEKGIVIEPRLPDRLTGTVDSNRLSQILLNILDNAIKYNIPGGRITVEAGLLPQDGFFIEVANTGEIIPPEKTGEIFGRFFRLDDDVATQGHGLGLSIARELTRAHGGDLVLEKSDRESTVFRATFPQRVAHEAWALQR